MELQQKVWLRFNPTVVISATNQWSGPTDYAFVQAPDHFFLITGSLVRKVDRRDVFCE